MIESVSRIIFERQIPCAEWTICLRCPAPERINFFLELFARHRRAFALAALIQKVIATAKATMAIAVMLAASFPFEDQGLRRGPSPSVSAVYEVPALAEGAG